MPYPDDPYLWIANYVVARGIPILPQNARHFTQIPSLQVLAYDLKR